jgi:hypothetical protein
MTSPSRKREIPQSLRRPEERYAARQVADALLRADARKQRAAAKPKPLKKAAPTIMAGPRRLHLTDLKRAVVERRWFNSGGYEPSTGGIRRNTKLSMKGERL